jgi:glycosyltransferase involved in cell wall biosynthesis
LKWIRGVYFGGEFNLSKSREESERLDITFISTYHPTRCGIATFTQNLRSALTKVDPSVRADVVAVDQERNYKYEPGRPEVILRIVKDERRAYVTLAKAINESRTDLVCIQHEFGIFGGVRGSYILDFMERCEKPIVTTLHTLNHNLNSTAYKVIRKIVENSDAVVVLPSIYREDLAEIYEASGDHKVEFIPHGVPEVKWPDKVTAKVSLRLSNRRVLTSFGLISPNKGLEYAVEALPKIIDRHPDTIYLILGQTHPRILRRYGEAYREKLEERVRALGLEDHVKFINSFLPEDNLSLYLAASDIYLAPYLNRDQSSSGCLTYALAHGMAVVSTPYPHSKYELAHSNGVMVPPRNSGEIVKAVNWLLGRPTRLVGLQHRAIERMKARRWPHVAAQYVHLSKTILEDKAHRELPLFGLTNVQTALKTLQQRILHR